MHGFTQYITEILDSSYPYEKVGSGPSGEPGETIHVYRFKDHKGNPVHVHLAHAAGNKTAELYFADKNGSIAKTGQYGHHALKIMSTVGKIAKDHADAHHELKSIHFTSAKAPSLSNRGNTLSRAKLYAHFTKRMGGTTDTSDSYEDKHTIPVNQDR